MEVGSTAHGSAIVAADDSPASLSPVISPLIVKFHQGPFVPNDPSSRIPTPHRDLPETADPQEHLWKPPPWVISDPQNRIVEGFASMPNLDDQGDIVPLSAIDDALPAYMQWANLREMHGKNAAGKILSASIKDGGVYVVGRVDDDDAWKKVQSGVYQGFSIGGDITDVDHQNGARIIRAMRLNEISLVDRPANPKARITVVKFQKHFTGKIHKHETVGKAESLSEAQRRWAFGVKGEAWAREHGFDNPGKLPERVGKVVTIATREQLKAIGAGRMCSKHMKEGCEECGCDRLVGHPLNTGHSSGMAKPSEYKVKKILVVQKYSPEEARAEDGKWTSGGGAAVAQKPAKLGSHWEGAVHHREGQDNHLRIREVKSRTWKTPDGQHHVRTSIDGNIPKDSTISHQTFPTQETARQAAGQDFRSTIRTLVGSNPRTEQVRIGVKRYDVGDYHTALRSYTGNKVSRFTSALGSTNVQKMIVARILRR